MEDAMKQCIVGMTGSLLIALLAPFSTTVAQDTESGEVTPRLRLGTFDSRAVAVAYARSETFAAKVGELREDLAKAKEDGNETRAKELEETGRALQQRLHRQGFGTAPVDEILEHIRAELPEIARRAGVDVIVSEWDLAYRDDSAELVDVTDLLVSRFDPDDETLKIVRERRDRRPVPPEQLERLEH
jgi:hypothetical protein